MVCYNFPRVSCDIRGKYRIHERKWKLFHARSKTAWIFFFSKLKKMWKKTPTYSSDIGGLIFCTHKKKSWKKVPRKSLEHAWFFAPTVNSTRAKKSYFSFSNFDEGCCCTHNETFFKFQFQPNLYVFLVWNALATQTTLSNLVQVNVRRILDWKFKTKLKSCGHSPVTVTVAVMVVAN